MTELRHEFVLNNHPPCNCTLCRTGVSHNANAEIREVADDEPMLAGLGIGEIVANERRKELTGIEQQRQPSSTVPVANEMTEEWPVTPNYAETYHSSADR